jgi:uncharacterized membrane protein
MPEISVFCPGCGRAVQPDVENAPVPEVAPLSRDALLGAVAYIAFVPALILLFLPALKGVRFIRFHSIQALLFVLGVVVVGGATRLLFVILAFFPFVGFLLAWLIGGLVALAVVFVWIVAVVKAALGDAYELPVIGPLAARWANPQ